LLAVADEHFSNPTNSIKQLRRYLESPLEDLLCLGSPDGAMDRDLLVPPNTEGPDGVSGLGEDGGLASKGFQHLAGTGQPITRLSNTDVEAELADTDVPHGVGILLLLLVGGHFDDPARLLSLTNEPEKDG